MEFAKRVTDFFQNGHLTHYLRLSLLGVVVILLHPTIQLMGADMQWPSAMGHAGYALLVLVPAIIAFRRRNRFAILALLGISGIGFILLFANYSAPDLAMTQIMVEALSVAFVVIAFRTLKRGASFSGRQGWALNLSLVGCFCVFISIMLLLNRADFPKNLTEFIINHSYSHAFGRNVVNVILVDFRAMDTLGETFVVATAAIGVVALLGMRKEGSPDV